jgi:hypothetical protein
MHLLNKTFLLFLLTITPGLLFSSFSILEKENTTAINEGDIFKDIENAVALGNAKLLSNYMSTSIEIEINGQEGIYSKSQAEQVLNKFFDKYPPRSFSLSHKGNSAAGARFAVGDYVTGKEHTFRVTIFLKKIGEHYLIQEIEFE